MKIVLAGVAILLVASVVGVGVEDQRRVEEATARMERFAVKLEHTKSVTPETMAVVSVLIHRYNCEQLSCGAFLENAIMLLEFICREWFPWSAFEEPCPLLAHSGHRD
jgi:hypothetical protein